VAEVYPLKGIHYNLNLLKDWTKVICPVYDIIPPEQREKLYQSSEYNFIRLEAGRELPQDTPEDNKYTRSAHTLSDWLKQGILVKDEKPAIYLHDHYFIYKNKQYKRRSMIARVRLEEWDKMIIRPHESTLAEAKSDRLSLLWSIQANTSSILSLYEDHAGKIKDILAEEAKRLPSMDLELSGIEGHQVWAINDPEKTKQISSLLGKQPLYIADGHHRYESALNYHRQKRATGKWSENEPFDFVMMTLVDFQDPGLLILPPHRLVRGVSKSAYESFMDKLKVFFNLVEVSFHNANDWQTLDNQLKAYKKLILVLFGVKPGIMMVLEPKAMDSFVPMMPQFHTDLYKQLEVSIIDHVILEKLLALSSDKDKYNLSYCYDRQDAVDRVTSGEFQMTFILTPIKAEVIKGIADQSDKMPKKSTYFYPKVPAGLILNSLV
jgi:uncharacterized protein (DUF1015 family)